MIFFLSSYFFFALALEYPSWGDWQHGAEMIKYDRLIPQPGCASTSKCATLIGNSFNGGELDLCLRSAKKGCQFIARPTASEIQGIYPTYNSWEDNGDELEPPTWSMGCNTSTTGSVLYATSIQQFQDYFATIPADDLEINNGFLEMILREEIENENEFELYLGNYQKLSDGCENVDLNDMAIYDLKDKWVWSGYGIRIPFDDIIGKYNVLATRYTGALSKETTEKSPKKDEWSIESRAPSVDQMSFRSERFLAYFKGSDNANSDSAHAAISLSLVLILSLVTLTM